MRYLTWLKDFLFWNVRISGVVATGDDFPARAFENWARLGRVVEDSKCNVCGRRFWSHKDLRVCGSFKCYRTLMQQGRR